VIEKFTIEPGLHAGEDVAILACGPSLEGVPADKLRARFKTIIGINDTWYHVEPDYQLSIDPVWWDEEPEYMARMAKAGKLLTVVTEDDQEHWPPSGQALWALPNPGWLKFSWDLTEGVYCAACPYVALQIAAWFGAKRAFLFGLDLDGAYFKMRSDATDEVSLRAKEAQLGEMKAAAEHLRGKSLTVVNCNPDSRTDAFERVPWTAVL
jgi:hypothetical protein